MNGYRTMGLAAAVALAIGVPAAAQDASQKVAGGGITVAGWNGQIDAKETAAGAKLADSKLAAMGKALHVTTGPAVVYWSGANKASGNYTVTATFSEPKYMSLNNHPHPYGIVVGGNDMGTDKQSYLYCAAYGNGTFIVRGFGPEPFQMNGGRGEPNPAVNKAAGKDQPVTQEIAVSVDGTKVSCSINGKKVAEYDRAMIVGPGKLKSTDGLYGIRFAHNTEAMVSDLKLIKQ